MNMIVLSVRVLRYIRTIVVDPDLLLSVFNNLIGILVPGSLLFYQRFKEIEQGHEFETVSFHRIWKQVKTYCLF
jgi:hypothetical protein